MSTELQVYRWAAGKQTAKGTSLAAPTRSFIGVTGDIAAAKDLGSENFSDGSTLFGDTTDWFNSVTGQGAVGFEFTADEAAWIMKTFAGGETVSADADRPLWNAHVVTPGTSLGDWTTWWKSQGLTIVQLQRFIDCLISQVQLEGSTANKAVRISPTVLSLNPAEKAAVPTYPALPDKNTVLLYTEASGTFTIDTVVVRGHSQFTVVLNKDLTPVFTDDVTPFEVQVGSPSATVACTIQADADGQAQWNKYMYGSTTPAAGTLPTKTVPAMGSYVFEGKKGTGTSLTNRLKFEAPGVRWNLPDWPAPNPDGGNPQLALAGGCRLISGQPLWRTTITCASPTFTS